MVGLHPQLTVRGSDHFARNIVIKFIIAVLLLYLRSPLPAGNPVVNCLPQKWAARGLSTSRSLNVPE
jgi:hypothetical protein